ARAAGPGADGGARTAGTPQAVRVPAARRTGGHRRGRVPAAAPATRGDGRLLCPPGVRGPGGDGGPRPGGGGAPRLPSGPGTIDRPGGGNLGVVRRPAPTGGLQYPIV